MLSPVNSRAAALTPCQSAGLADKATSPFFIPADIHRLAFKAEGGRQAHGSAAVVGKQFGHAY